MLCTITLHQDDTRSEVMTLTRQLGQREAEVDKLREGESALRDSIRSLETRLAETSAKLEMTDKHSAERVQTLKSEVEEQRASKEALSGELRKSEDTIKELREQLGNKQQEFEQQAASTKIELARSVEELQLCRADKEAATQRAVVAEATTQEVEGELMSARRERDRVAGELKAARDNVTELSGKLPATEGAMAELRRQVELLKGDKEELGKQVKLEKEQLEAVRHELQVARATAEEKTKAEERRRAEIDELRASLSAAEADEVRLREDASASVDELQFEATKHRRIAEEANSTASSLRTELDSLRSSLEGVRGELDDARQQLGDAKRRESEMEAAHKTMQDKVANLTMRLEVESQINQQQSTLGEQIEQLRDKEREAAAMATQLAELRRTLETKEGQIREAEERYKTAQDDLSACRQNLGDVQRGLEREEEVRAETQRKLEEATRRAEALEKQMEDKEAVLANLVRGKEEADKHTQQLESELEGSQRNVAKLEKMMKSNRLKLDAALVEIASLKADSHASAATLKVPKGEDEATELRESLVSAKLRVAEAEEEVASTTTKQPDQTPHTHPLSSLFYTICTHSVEEYGYHICKRSSIMMCWPRRWSYATPSLTSNSSTRNCATTSAMPMPAWRRYRMGRRRRPRLDRCDPTPRTKNVLW